MDNSLTDIELKAFFDCMFPKGFAGKDVLNEIALEGWHKSSLFACFHPSAEQVYKECLRMHHNLASLIRDQDKGVPEPTFEEIRAQWKEDPINIADEVTELVGRSVWDIFSDNHEVVVAGGRVADIGSFRGAGAFIDGYLSGEKGSGLWGGDYLKFYLGTSWMNIRADLRVVYVMIFRRLKSQGADWVYYFPQIHAFDPASLCEGLESPTEYSPSEAFAAQQEEEHRKLGIEKFRADLVDFNRQAKKEAMDGPVPTTVEAYSKVYGHNPRGWPPA